MKLNRLINNANLILNSNNYQPNSLSRNKSQISLSNNNDINKTNVSITTNASAIKNIYSPRNNMHISMATSPKNIFQKKKFFKNSLQLENFVLLSPTSSRMKQQLNLMGKADDIVKDRLKNKELDIGKAIKYAKKPALKLSKDISLKNYAINLLKNKRTEINEKERIMNNALKEFEKQFNFDNRKFNEYIEDVRAKQKKIDDIIAKLKKEREEKEVQLKEKMQEYKQLEDNIEKILKIIYTSNIYAVFFHKVFNIPFNYNNLPSLNRNYNFEDIAEIIIDIYETKDKDVKLPDIIKDDNILTQRYVEMEDIILHNLRIRDIIVKEISKYKENYQRELKILENSYKEYEKDLDYLKEETKIINKSMKYVKIQETDDIDYYTNYIIELGKEIIDKIPIKNSQNNNNGYLSYCKKVLKALRDKEANINNYINEIELILNYGEKDDKMLLEKYILERKKYYKKVNQLNLKIKQEQLEFEKNMRYMKRAERMVVKGRSASPIFPPIKNVHKIRRIDLKDNENEIECIYSVTDEEN